MPVFTDVTDLSTYDDITDKIDISNWYIILYVFSAFFKIIWKHSSEEAFW